ENEHAIGKIEDEDYEQVAATYRQELKVVLKKIDDSLAPHRAKAEELARSHLVRAGIIEAGYRGEQPASGNGNERTKPAKPARVGCPRCREPNEPDAKFCKDCAPKLGAAAGPGENESADPPKKSADA